jgi:hypothetical protein
MKKRELTRDWGLVSGAMVRADVDSGVCSTGRDNVVSLDPKGNAPALHIPILPSRWSAL